MVETPYLQQLCLTEGRLECVGACVYVRPEKPSRCFSSSPMRGKMIAKQPITMQVLNDMSQRVYLLYPSFSAFTACQRSLWIFALNQKNESTNCSRKWNFNLRLVSRLLFPTLTFFFHLAQALYKVSQQFKCLIG